MNENINFTPYFASPIYVGDLPELLETLNKISDKFIIDSKKSNLEFIKNREKKLKKKNRRFWFILSFNIFNKYTRI